MDPDGIFLKFICRLISLPFTDSLWQDSSRIGSLQMNGPSAFSSTSSNASSSSPSSVSEFTGTDFTSKHELPHFMLRLIELAWVHPSIIISPIAGALSQTLRWIDFGNENGRRLIFAPMWTIACMYESNLAGISFNPSKISKSKSPNEYLRFGRRERGSVDWPATDFGQHDNHEHPRSTH